MARARSDSRLRRSGSRIGRSVLESAPVDRQDLEMSGRRDDIDAVIRRVRWRSFAIAGAAGAVAFALGWQAGVSLTIGAVVVIFSFLVLEKLTARLVPQREKPKLRTLAPLLLVTAASLVLLTIVLWRWKGFDPLAGAAGLSVVVAAVVPELWRDSERRRET